MVIGEARMRLQGVKPRDVVETEVIAVIDFDDLPIVGSHRRGIRQCQHESISTSRGKNNRVMDHGNWQFDPFAC